LNFVVQRHEVHETADALFQRMLGLTIETFGVRTEVI